MTVDPTVEDTMAILAKSNWEPWEGRAEDGDTVPTAEVYSNGPAIQLRMCVMIMHKSKANLMKIAKDMFDQPAMREGDENLWDGFVKNVQSAKLFAECLLELASTAEARCFAAVATLAAEDGNV